MALLLETTVGDIVIDLDIEGSPELCRNVLKLAKARYYTSTLIYNVIPNRYCQLGDPRGDGTGGGCIYALLDTTTNDITTSTARFLKSSQGRVLTKDECRQRGMVVATEMNGIRDTIGSQFLMTLEGGEQRGLDGYIQNTTTERPTYLSLGRVTEDDDGVLDKIHNCYCDAHGRPFADIRIERALVIHDPFEDPPGFQELLQTRGIVVNDEQHVTHSPSYERPPDEVVEMRISVNQVDEHEDEDDEELNAQRQEQIAQQEDKSRAVVLEMLGDLPSADIKAPENVLFVCKLNSITQDEDLELIFSRFDPNVKVEIIRDFDTGASLQYAFCEFTTKKQCVEAYFKMNGALIDDRRIKVDFSQSVAKIWDRYHQKMKPQRLDHATDTTTTQQQRSSHGSRGRGGRGGRGRGGFQPNGDKGGRGQQQQQQYRSNASGSGPSRDYHRRHDDRSPPRERDERHYHGDHYRDRYRNDYREDRRQHHDDYSPGDMRRRRRSRSPSPDEEQSQDYKRRRHHHSRKRDRRDRSRSRHDDERKRRDRSRSRSPARRRHDSEDNGHKGSGRDDGGESQSRQRENDDKDRHHWHDEERRHRKKHHRRDRDDRHKSSKRKHKERRRHSRSRSRS